jgi:hypothetical protein
MLVSPVRASRGPQGQVGRVGRFEIAVRVQGVQQFLGDPAEMDRIHLGGVVDQGVLGLVPDLGGDVGGIAAHRLDHDAAVFGAEGAGAEGGAEFG